MKHSSFTYAFSTRRIFSVFIFVLASVFIFACSFAANSFTAAERPNIVLIMSDDMGYSDIGCYGGEIKTPSLDGLAKNGIRFTQFYNTARCCPTRASLLSGLHPHQAGIGHMVEGHNLPGYGGDLLPSCITIAEALKPAGYSNYAVGKWHVTGNFTDESRRHNWPLNRGFEKYYGIITGATNFFEPATLVRDENPISPFDDPEYKPEGEYYFTNAISDNAVKYIREHKKNETEKPFFMYVAYTAAHWPMQALPEDIAKYKGKYDSGYAPVRAARYERMKEMGLIKDEWKLPPKDGDWSKVANKDWEAACMEVYAAMIDCMDQGIGRIVDSLKETGQYENTIIIFLQDNGACAENSGRSPREDYPERPGKPVYEPYPPERIVHRREETRRTREGYPVIHGPNVMPGPKDTFIAYGKGWANVSNTPFREYKHWIHEGGISTPLIIHAPSLVSDSMKGKFYTEYGQLIDIMSTCIDLGGAKYPEKRRGIALSPLEGTSLSPALKGEPLGRKLPLFWEHEGNRAIREGKWKLVAKGPQGEWELYDMEHDRSETANLAAEYPEIVEKMGDRWLQWAHHAKVLPWPWGAIGPVSSSDKKPGLKFELDFTGRNSLPGDSSGNDIGLISEGKLTFERIGDEFAAIFDGKSWLQVEKAPALSCQDSPWAVESEILPESSNGVIVSQGGVSHGYSLCIKDGKPLFAIRISGKVHSVAGPDKIESWTRLGGCLSEDKKIRLFVDGKLVGEKQVPGFIAQYPGDPLLIGNDLGGQVTAGQIPVFEGKVKRIRTYRGPLP